MQAVYFVGTINDALRGKRLLEQQGIRAYIQKLRADDEHGCGYGLAVDAAFSKAASLLKQSGLSIREMRGRENS